MFFLFIKTTFIILATFRYNKCAKEVIKHSEIINIIVNDKTWKDLCTKLGRSAGRQNKRLPLDLGDDLYQEFILIVLEYNKESLIDIYKNDRLDYFCWRVITTQWYGSKSEFTKKYKRYYTIDVHEFIETNTDTRTPSEKEAQEDFIKVFNEVYNRLKNDKKVKVYEMMTRVYLMLGTYREIESEIAVSHTTCKRYVDKFRDIVKSECNKLLMDNYWN